MIRKGRAADMGDGWETARRLDRPAVLEVAASAGKPAGDEGGALEIPGYEWCAFKLGFPGFMKVIEVDTNHFKGNFPDSIAIEGEKKLT